jgi:magnesium chelatase subunit I
VVPRVSDIYAAIPSLTGKFELEYEGELRGADNVARDVIRAAVGNVFSGYFAGADLRQVTDWFDLGGSLQIDDTLPAAELLRRTSEVQGLHELTHHTGIRNPAKPPLVASAVDFILEGLYAQKKITRSDEWQYAGAEPGRRTPRTAQEPLIEREIPLPGNKKKYYN